MLRAPKAYDAALNVFSHSITPRIRYEMDDQQRLTVLNKTDRLYRYYDATTQAEYLYEAAAETIRKDLREEIEFLEVFDKSMTALKNIVDMRSRGRIFLLNLKSHNKTMVIVRFGNKYTIPGSRVVSIQIKKYFLARGVHFRSLSECWSRSFFPVG